MSDNPPSYPPYGSPCNTCGATISARQQRKHAEWHRKYMPMEPLTDVELPEPKTVEVNE